MSTLALLCGLIGLGLLVYALWRDRTEVARARRELAEEERRLRELVHDERAAYNGIYAPAERHIKAVRHVPPRPPQP